MDLGAACGTPATALCRMSFAQRCVAHSRGLTDRLPMPKPKKTLPRKKTVMLVLQHAGEYARKTPDTASGWLWCFPEVAHSEDTRICARRFGARVVMLKPARAQAWLTHFHLSITPQQLRSPRWRRALPSPAISGCRWRKPGQRHPTPVKRILAGL